MTGVDVERPAPGLAEQSRSVLIACPVTGDLVPAGMWVSDLNDLEGTNSLLACPSCGADHEWEPLEAVLSPGGSAQFHEPTQS